MIVKTDGSFAATSITNTGAARVWWGSTSADTRYTLLLWRGCGVRKWGSSIGGNIKISLRWKMCLICKIIPEAIISINWVRGELESSQGGWQGGDTARGHRQHNLAIINHTSYTLDAQPSTSTSRHHCTAARQETPAPPPNCFSSIFRNMTPHSVSPPRSNSMI